MDKISDVKAVQDASVNPSWTEIKERELLARLAAEVPAGGLILETGCLYAGATSVLALAAPEAEVWSVDDFSWTPEGYPKASIELAKANLEKIGAKNAHIIWGDSREIGKIWGHPIDLCWIDGGHSYEYVFEDLKNFGTHAKVIALHDYKNPAWPTVEKAIEDFMEFTHNKHQLMVDEVVGWIAVLRLR